MTSKPTSGGAGDSPQADGVVVAALYRFVRLADFAELRAPLLELMRRTRVRGTLLLASEGINGTIAGSRAGVDQVLGYLRQDSRLAGLEVKESLADDNPFYRSRVKLKKEIVTMGVPGIDPQRAVGTYVSPGDWNALLDDPDVLLVDTRNEYEIRTGRFANATNPHTQTFREFPEYAAKHLDAAKHKKVAMYCTGGIRCEKATAYLKGRGFDEVYHLRGGILKYLEEVPADESRWQGECFVFDNRVTVNHQLEPGSYDQCHACRMPITAADKDSPHYTAGISCPHCVADHSAARQQGRAERVRQMALAKQRGEAHIGQAAAERQAERRREKLRIKARQRKTG